MTSDPWAPGQNPWLDERMLRVEKTLAWSRLATLHEQNGAAAAADAAWLKAEAYARAGSWKSPTRDHLRGVVAAQLASNHGRV